MAYCVELHGTQTVRLGPRHGYIAPKGLLHRHDGPVLTAVLLLEQAGSWRSATEERPEEHKPGARMSQQTSGQRWEQEVLAADGDFFTALVVGDAQALDSVLADGFVVVGVNDGAVVPRAALVALVGRGQLQFDTIEPDRSQVLVRRYGRTAIVVGRTEMRGGYDGAPFSARSRYTHVFVEDQGRWRLASAQGTPIVGD